LPKNKNNRGAANKNETAADKQQTTQQPTRCDGACENGSRESPEKEAKGLKKSTKQLYAKKWSKTAEHGNRRRTMEFGKLPGWLGCVKWPKSRLKRGARRDHLLPKRDNATE